MSYTYIYLFEIEDWEITQFYLYVPLNRNNTNHFCIFIAIR